MSKTKKRKKVVNAQKKKSFKKQQKGNSKKKSPKKLPTKLSKSSKKKKQPAKVKKIKRDRFKYPGLEPQGTNRIRREYLDYDYLDQLSDKDKKWLNDFTEEWLGAKVDKDTKQFKINKGKEARKKIFDANNARNRCLLSVSKARNRVVHDEELIKIKEEKENQVDNPGQTEDILIELIDKKND